MTHHTFTRMSIPVFVLISVLAFLTPNDVDGGPSDPGISTKGEIIRDRMNRALDSAYKIKSILIGRTDNETINEDAPVTCLDDELNRIDAKLCRLNYILDEIVERL